MTTNLEQLHKTKEYLLTHLPPEKLEEILAVNLCIKEYFQGDGAGLASGTISDMYMKEYFREAVPNFTVYEEEESDIKIDGIPFSLKKIYGASIIALDWSRNDVKEGVEPQNVRTYFTTNMILINLKTEQWWKSKPVKPKIEGLVYNHVIPAGIYLVDKDFCKEHTKLSKNNKTNTLIEKEYLYQIIQHSMDNDLCILFPSTRDKYDFCIRSAFTRREVPPE